MFAQNEEDKKLDWMYKGPNSMVDREEYLLGRSVDKTLEQINAEEKEKKLGIAPPKNHVEHECIPPSIRDYNKIVHVEQVDLSAKLQEDPLVAIKKREEETRRQFLQNPVQLKKLQKALKAQEAEKLKKKKKRKKSHKHQDSDSDSDIDKKIAKKLRLLKDSSSTSSFSTELPTKSKKKTKHKALDTILMHKFNQLKDKLSEEDLKEILERNDSANSSSEEEVEKQKKDSRSRDRSEDKQLKRDKHGTQKKSKYPSKDSDNKKNKKESSHRRNKSNERKRDDSSDSSSDSDEDKRKKSSSHSKKSAERKDKKTKKKRSSSSDSTSTDSSEDKYGRKKVSRYEDSEDEVPQKKNWGLVKSDGSKIELKGKYDDTKKHINRSVKKSSITSDKQKLDSSSNKKKKQLSEEEKEKLRSEMMKNAAHRDKERGENLKKYREREEKEEKMREKDYRTDFVHRELMKSANTASVETRIKANLNNIQRSSRHMDSNFSRR